MRSEVDAVREAAGFRETIGPRVSADPMNEVSEGSREGPHRGFMPRGEVLATAPREKLNRGRRAARTVRESRAADVMRYRWSLEDPPVEGADPSASLLAPTCIRCVVFGALCGGARLGILD